MKKIIYLIIIVLILGGVYLFKENSSKSIVSACIQNNGTWIFEQEECEGISQNWCDINGGIFNECGSACRHEKEAVMCTLQCVPFCSFSQQNESDSSVKDFISCVEAGNSVMESYPRQCRDKVSEQVFTENLNSQESLKDLIILENIKDGQKISNPLILEGKARGNWYFEGSFPVILTNWDGLIIAEGYATSQGDWMVEDFVPFKANLEFTKPEKIEGVENRGSLILKKDNPSGLPQYDNALELTVFFE
ncbi:MAG: Gmad2 immunoglobulin-like domain-containing protein [Patescibacteria group bacterium]